MLSQVKRKTAVNPETCESAMHLLNFPVDLLCTAVKSILESGAVLDSNTDKFVEMINRFGEPEAPELAKPLQLDIGEHSTESGKRITYEHVTTIDSCKSFCSKLENSLGQPSHELLVRLNKQLCS